MKIFIIMMIVSLNVWAQTATYNFNFNTKVETASVPTTISAPAPLLEKKMEKRELGHGLSGSVGFLDFAGAKMAAIPYSMLNVVLNSGKDRDVVLSFGNVTSNGHAGRIYGLGFQRFYDLGKHLSLKRSVSLMFGSVDFNGATGQDFSYVELNFSKFGYSIGPEWHYKFVSAYIIGELFYGSVKYKNYDGYYTSGRSYDGNFSAHLSEVNKNTYGYSISTGFTLRI